MALAGAGTAASGRPSAGPVLGSTAQIHQYLRSIGVNPRSVVIQRGLHNYAGPKCPGKAWTCSSARRVFQSGSDNKFECSPSTTTVAPPVNTDAAQSCVIVQTGTQNSARCTERTKSATAAQTCTITQTGADNKAQVDQTVESDGATQDATQTATVTQTGATVGNALDVSQKVKQGQGTDDDADDPAIAADASLTGTTTQDAHQRVDVIQTALLAGSNSSQVNQSESQHAHGGDMQNQNTLGGTTDCAPELYPSPNYPNACVNVAQTAVAGNNTNRLRQSIIEKALMKAAGSQYQGQYNNGIDAKVHLESVTGTSKNDAGQSKRQSAKGGTVQIQYDPVYCCGAGSTLGSTASSETIDQRSNQVGGPGAYQSNIVFGVSTSSGACSIAQRASDNADSKSNQASINPCPFLSLQTSCSSGVFNEGPPPGCVAGDPVTTPPCNTDSCGVIGSIRALARRS